jgi:hypothetical protein
MNAQALIGGVSQQLVGLRRIAHGGDRRVAASGVVARNLIDTSPTSA